MPKETWIIASILTILLLLVLLGYASWGKKHEVEQVRAELAAAREAAVKSEAEIADLKGRLAQSQAQIPPFRPARAWKMRCAPLSNRRTSPSRDCKASSR
jgi:Tfp pilus assembly protein PilE